VLAIKKLFETDDQRRDDRDDGEDGPLSIYSRREESRFKEGRGAGGDERRTEKTRRFAVS